MEVLCRLGSRLDNGFSLSLQLFNDTVKDTIRLADALLYLITGDPFFKEKGNYVAIPVFESFKLLIWHSIIWSKGTSISILIIWLFVRGTFLVIRVSGFTTSVSFVSIIKSKLWLISSKLVASFHLFIFVIICLNFFLIYRYLNRNFDFNIRKLKIKISD